MPVQNPDLHPIAELMARSAVAAKRAPTCWVVVEGVQFPIPVTQAHDDSLPTEPMRMYIPGTEMYMQYTPEVGLDTTPGAALHYMDGKKPNRDSVPYECARRLPFAPEFPTEDNRSFVCRAFPTRSAAIAAL